MTKFLNISTDNTLGGNSPSDVTVSSQKAVKEYVDSHGGGGSVAVDNKSITTNVNSQIQTVGVINQNATTTAIKTWTGTRAQYNAIVTKDADTLYNITDDTSISLSVLEALYPVGSVYITTANTCPLSTLISGSTWSLVSSGRVLQGADSGHAAGTTIEAGLPDHSHTLYERQAYAAGSANNAVHLSGNSSYQSGLASESNPIYGNSNTVQPPAYCVNIFRRTA